MIRALDSRSNGPGSRSAAVIVLCSWARHFTLIVPFSISIFYQVHIAQCYGNWRYGTLGSTQTIKIILDVR